MAKILSRYSKANDLTKVEYTSQKEYMEALEKKQVAEAPGDLNSPYNYREWYQRNTGIISGEEYKQYNEYLKNWYLNRYTSTDAVSNIKNDYKTLLKEITLG